MKTAPTEFHLPPGSEKCAPGVELAARLGRSKVEVTQMIISGKLKPSFEGTFRGESVTCFRSADLDALRIGGPKTTAAAAGSGRTFAARFRLGPVPRGESRIAAVSNGGFPLRRQAH